ncbi:unnamed protein product [Didymodactylos carnosus]|uniref:Poly [ADP-ribose] polymerase n=1 Tax=Didymodactylos carnosus TaxID=1234261 RepID=A0A814HC56_9BILA|nr:unnamed protein product [Didymodactylos carnosus]CAF3778964.1 unnamed protein product [Didymodactylos carnosus]
MSSNSYYLLDVIIIPSKEEAPQIDDEMVELLLSKKGWNITKMTPVHNQHGRRFIIQFAQTESVDKLITQSVLTFHDAAKMKMKRTIKQIDKQCFVLKILGDTKIDQRKINLYTEILIGISEYSIDDITVNHKVEQIYLIKCEQDIDLIKLFENYAKKSQLQNKEVQLVQIYEIDMLDILFEKLEGQQMLDKQHVIESSKDIIPILFSSSLDEIFSFSVFDDKVSVEFIDSHALKRWMKTNEYQSQYNIRVRPTLQVVENEIITKEMSSNKQKLNIIQNDLTSVEKVQPDRCRPSSGIIKPLITKPQPDYSMIATTSPMRKVEITFDSQFELITSHPVVQLDYKKFIRSYVDYIDNDIEIHGCSVTCFVSNEFGKLAPTDLLDTTKKFMEKFVIKELREPTLEQMNTLDRENCAYRQLPDKKGYMVAAKRTVMDQLLQIQSPLNQSKLSTNNSRVDSSPLSHPPSVLQTEIIRYPIESAQYCQFFDNDMFQIRFKQYLRDTYMTNTNVKRENDQSSLKMKVIIELNGRYEDICSARNAIENLFTSLQTTVYNEQNVVEWIKVADSVHVIQDYFNRKGVICACQQLRNGLKIYYFRNPQFGTEENQISDAIDHGVFLFEIVTISSKSQTISKLVQKLDDFYGKLRQRPDYNKTICCDTNETEVYLFGLTGIVLEIKDKFESIKDQYEPKLHKLQLEQNQIKYLLNMRFRELQALEAKHKDDGVEILSNIVNSSILAPVSIYEQHLKRCLLEYARTSELEFDIREPLGFSVLIQNQEYLLTDIANRYSCYIETKIETQKIPIAIPKANVKELASVAQTNDAIQLSVPSSPNAIIAGPVTTTSNSSLKVANGTIDIHFGDLTTETADVIVLCRSSTKLCDAIVKVAGDQVLNEYQAISISSKQIAISAGSLKCKMILFQSWQPHKNDELLRKSVSDFVSDAIQYVTDNNYTSISFPALGCGNFGCSANVIADTMINETKSQLKNLKKTIIVSFVLLAQQKTVYDEFCNQLNPRLIDNNKSGLFNRAAKVISGYFSTNTQDNATSSSESENIEYFDQEIVQITLTTSAENKDALSECRQAIEKQSKSGTLKKEWKDKQDMRNWTQQTINKYYIYCLERKILPQLDIINGHLQLNGLKESVLEAEKYIYQLLNDTYRQERVQIISQGVIWSYEVSDDVWKNYSFKTNAEIEVTYQHRVPSIDIIDEEFNRCRVYVDNRMNEECGKQVRRIRRKEINQKWPDHWSPKHEDTKCIPLNNTSKEYKDVVDKFNSTMTGRYSQIIKIERVENERWYIQYAAHRDESKRKYKNDDCEKTLFHGLPSDKTAFIINECFNRSYAGVNGTVYGFGVYFATNARYSNRYAIPDTSTGERCMFIAKVLIGRAIRGDSSMKTAPAGYDSTTDQNEIFVTYHDAQAYAEYLITYK